MISKSAATLAATGVGGTGAAAVGGAYYLGAFEGSSSGATPASTQPPALMVQTFKDFRKEDDLTCINSILPELYTTIKESLDNSTTPSGATEITENNKLEDNFFENPIYAFNNCLVVNWDKKLNNEGKWHGTFRYLWGFNHDKQALIMFNSLESAHNEAKLKMTGGVYFIKMISNSWKIYKYKKWTIENSSTITPQDFDQKFPGVGDVIPDKSTFQDGKDYWGFVTGKDDLNKICVNCSVDQLPTHNKFRGKWDWTQQNGGNSKPMDWMKNSDSWFSKTYPEISNFQTVMNGKFANMKGKWTKKAVTTSPSQGAGS